MAARRSCSPSSSLSSAAVTTSSVFLARRSSFDLPAALYANGGGDEDSDDATTGEPSQSITTLPEQPASRSRTACLLVPIRWLLTLLQMIKLRFKEVCVLAAVTVSFFLALHAG